MFIKCLLIWAAMIIKDHKDNLNRELSLVEQKKMQWAKERGEWADQFLTLAACFHLHFINKLVIMTSNFSLQMFTLLQKKWPNWNNITRSFHQSMNGTRFGEINFPLEALQFFYDFSSTEPNWSPMQKSLNRATMSSRETSVWDAFEALVFHQSTRRLFGKSQFAYELPPIILQLEGNSRNWFVIAWFFSTRTEIARLK